MNLFPTLLEAGKSKVTAPAHTGSAEGPPSWLADACSLRVSSRGRGRESKGDQRQHFSLLSSHKGARPTLGAPSRDLIPLGGPQPLTASYWGLRLQHNNFGGMQTSSP